MPNRGQRGSEGHLTGAGERATFAGRRGMVAGAAAAAVASALLLGGCGNSDSGPQKVASVGGPVTSGASVPAAGTGKEPTPQESGSGSGQGSPTPPPGADSSGSSSAAPQRSGGTGGTGGGGKTPPPAAPTRCHTSELRLTIGDDHPGAGQEDFALVLTNMSGHTCTVSGFPGLAFVDNGGSQVSVDPERTGSSGGPVKVAPGASAWAPLTFTNPDVSGAGKVTPPTVRVTPPDEKVALIVPWNGGAVPADGSSGPQVGSFSAGSGG
ncbi:DUF4232 domain-containing protein [Streptomyces sp. NBC_01020]|uniref:DUF4232 domain-containing protein n=1 Tax=unclassified Streptomyces TaxID=2593676 RepID=UPI003243DC37|nr:DUF4232 domain-containing protein [Streptomyces sp. NBC_01020]WSX66650.1 DUF4232 domain-containing protein [Streptomyces sp. NBC_00932]